MGMDANGNWDGEGTDPSIYGMNDRGIGQDGTLPDGGVQDPGLQAPTATIDPVDITGHRGPPGSPDNPIPDGATPTGGNSPFNLSQFLSGLGSTGINLTQLIAGLTAAHNLNREADTFPADAERYATQLNPYGAYRDAAAQRLAALQNDPSSIVNTPGYKFSLSQGLGAIANRDNQSFGLGAGSTNPDMMDYAQGLASKTYNDTIKQYSDEAGVGIGPQSAASMLQTGLVGKYNAKNAALAAMFGGLGGNNSGKGGGGGNDPISAGLNAFKKAFGSNASAAGVQSVADATKWLHEHGFTGGLGDYKNGFGAPGTSVPIDPNTGEPYLTGSDLTDLNQPGTFDSVDPGISMDQGPPLDDSGSINWDEFFG